MEQDHQARPGGDHTTSTGGHALASVPLTFEAERYRSHVAALGLSEDRENEMLAAVWQIMRSFVDLAFGDDAAQLARNSGDSRAVAREANGSRAVGLADTPQPDNRAGLVRVFRQSGGGE